MVAKPLMRLFARYVRLDNVGSGSRGLSKGHAGNAAHLERCAHTFVIGAQLYAAHPDTPYAALESVPAQRRGFAYEGAAMIAAMADLTLAAGRGRHLRTLLAGPGYRYRHLVHVGAGWGLSVLRCPTPRALTSLCPLLRWLAIDGLAFHRQFVDPERTLYRLPDLPDNLRTFVFAAGVGRALWFTHTADLPRIQRTIASRPGRLQASMWSGVALAACYAGRATPLSPEELRISAASYIKSVRQGLTFAGAALQEHGLDLSTGQRELLRSFGVDPDTPACLAATKASDLTTHKGPIENYESWRARLGEASLLPSPVSSPVAALGEP